LADGETGGAFGLADATPQEAGQQRERWDDDGDGEGQPRAEPQHCRGDSDEADGFAEQGDDAGGEQVVDGFHIGGGARDGVTGRGAVVVVGR
jgi:hypothetical protein